MKQLTVFDGSMADGRPFESARDEFYDALLAATLSDCEHTSAAIMHAVHWGEPEVIADQLGKSREVDPNGLGLMEALEVAWPR